MDQQRPPIDTITTGADFRRWDWTRAELIDHARALRVVSSGTKPEILDRIAHFLDTGTKTRPPFTKADSKFDWHAEPLDDTTVLTASYKNTQNVRRYFKSRLGDDFRFSREYMAWMKANVGKTLADACDEYRAMNARKP